MKIMGYRISATGVLGYEFYENHKLICTANSIIVPSPPVRISGYGYEWNSEFDQESTIIPGLTRYVLDHKTKEEVFRIIFKESGRYEILFKDDCIRAYIENNNYIFFLGETKIAQTEKVCETFAQITKRLQYYDSESYFSTSLSESMKPKHILAVLSFPILRFAY